MFSPTAIKSFVETMNAKNNSLVPNFVFPLNNQSSSSNPRKEAFKFRDGIIIVSIPILSEKNVYECLSTACKAFDVAPPVRWDIAHIIRGTNATESVENARKVAEMTKRNRRISDVARKAEWNSKSFSYFDFPIQSPTPQPNPSRSMKPAARSILDNRGTGPTELIKQRPTLPALHSPSDDDILTQHIENRPSPSNERGPATATLIEERFVDGSDWQDRLVPSAKMENARRQYLTKLIERSNQTKIWDMDSEDEEEGGVLVAAGPVLLTRDGQRRSIAVQTTNPTPDIWARVNTWRKDVAKELGMMKNETNLFRRNMSTRLGIASVSMPPATNNTASNRPAAEKWKRCSQDWRRAREQAAANRSRQPWPTKILPRHSQLANNSESGEAELKDEKIQDSLEPAKVSVIDLEAMLEDSAIVLEKEYEASGAI